MGNSFALFEVSMEFSQRQFHPGEICHTQKGVSPWATEMPIGKTASVTTPVAVCRYKWCGVCSLSISASLCSFPNPPPPEIPQWYSGYGVWNRVWTSETFDLEKLFTRNTKMSKRTKNRDGYFLVSKLEKEEMVQSSITCYLILQSITVCQIDCFSNMY